ncbi:hypothetical protein OUZ56_006470 [Daphnia magna]|uniref:GMP synthase n=1 Tax=Daphnia magna TaxID=35525 RepID=A0ABQ9YVR4_9CRUS|nr:hypothetical protein OUZ56_006470 [Daphnia magna]
MARTNTCVDVYGKAVAHGGESLREIILSFQLSVLKVPELMRPDGKSTYSSNFFYPLNTTTLCCLKPSSLSGLFITCMEANTTTNPLLSPAHHWSGC